MEMEDIVHVCKYTRNELSTGIIRKYEIERLYAAYNFVPNLAEFVETAISIFPNLNCGISSVLLKHRLGHGDIWKGKFELENHTFLLLNDNTIIDLTADQYGGPPIYIGQVKRPWKL